MGNPLAWGALIQPAQDPVATSFAAQQTGLQVGQKLAQIHALQGVDINDPQSIDNAIGASIRALAPEQAQALQGLAYQRFQQQGLRELAGQPLAPTDQEQAPDQTQQPAPMSDAQTAHMRGVMNFAKDSAENLLELKDPQLRQEAAQSIRAKAVSMGVEPQAIDAAMGDLSDAHLQDVAQHYGQVVDHPAFGGTGPNTPLQPHHTNTVSLSDPRVLNNLALRSLYGQNIEPLTKAIQGGMGYTGAVSPGQTTVLNGQPQFAAPFAPEKIGPGEKLVSPNTGETIAAAPFKPEFVNTPPADTYGAFNPNTGQLSTGGAPQSLKAAILGQESGNNSAAPTSVSGAVGPGQLTVHTFAQFAQPGEKIDNPADNRAVSGRAIDHYMAEYGGDAARAAVAYFSGEGNVAPPGSPTPWKHDVKDPTGQSVSGYVAGVQARMSGQTGLNPGKLVSGPTTVPGVPGLWAIHPDGSRTPFEGTVKDPATLRDVVLKDEQYKGAREAMQTYAQMKSQAPTMTGPAAFAMMDSLVRSLNPGAVARQSSLDALESTFGLPARLLGQFQGFGGKSPLTTDMRQQILDATYNAVKSHYSQAKDLNDSNAALAPRYNLNPEEVKAPLGNLPAQFFIKLPDPAQRSIGKVYETPKGAFVWMGGGWRKATS